jgi:hypothetical protein
VSLRDDTRESAQLRVRQLAGLRTGIGARYAGRVDRRLLHLTIGLD